MLIFVISFSSNSCSRKMNFEISSVVPAARGYVKVGKDSNKNYKLKLNVKYLAESKRLEEKNNEYVIWMETKDATPMNIGRIESSKSGMSRVLKAKFKTVSTFDPKRIFITAESDAKVQYPIGATILTTK